MKRYWYKFRVKYGKALDTGKNKKVSEEYLVDAESFTETEKRATKAATELIGTRDFDITAISREPITEILKEDERMKATTGTRPLSPLSLRMKTLA